jgi:hypothetical protein
MLTRNLTDTRSPNADAEASRSTSSSTAAAATALARQITEALGTPTPNIHALTTSERRLHLLLVALRRSVLRRNHAHAHLVASGLSDLDTAIATLVRAAAQPDPNAQLELLAQGASYFDQAQKQAQRAGHAWPL